MHCNMNDADVSFSSFYSNQLQHADMSLSTPIHALEHDHFTGLFEDDQALLSIPMPMPTAITSAATHKGDNNGNHVEAACIPFVQIHTTDLQQQPEPNRSYRNGFRRKTAEIKSEAELIKSELAEAAAKERINATPTPPTSKPISSELVTSTPPLHKCPNCPFLSLCPQKAQVHMSSCFGVAAQPQMQCPGCANVFYSIDVLNLHLSQDHRLESQEISTLLLTLRLTGESNETAAQKPPQQTQTHLPPPKSRIFIKNVDCLREPHREQDVNLLPDFLPMLPSPSDSSTGNILDLIADVEAGVIAGQQMQQGLAMPMPLPLIHQKPPGQKISIKSVDVLREPALLPFDFQLARATDQQMSPLPALMIGDSLLDVRVIGVEPEEPRRQPKIYIRNVDILKEPMLLPGMDFNNAPAASATVPSREDVYTTETLLTPTGPVASLNGFEPALAPLNNICGEAFNFEAVLSGAGNASNSTSNHFTTLDLDFGVDFEHEDVPLAMAPTTTPAPQLPPLIAMPNNEQLLELGAAQPQVELNNQLVNYLPAAAATTTTTTPTRASKQKIFIKNVDILKSPQRGTLHLRTVDELNLMNRNEVEHLIVPNREPQPILLPHSESAATLEPSLIDFDQHPQPPPPPLSYGDSFDLGEDLEIWPWMEESMPAAITGTETGTEQASEQLELPDNAEDVLNKDFPQLYTSETSTADAVPPVVPTQMPSLVSHQVPPLASPQVPPHVSPPVPPPASPTVPPLVPVTGSTAATESSENLCGLPVPPLVPLAADETAAAPAPVSVPAACAEKPARIYVANNLLPAVVAQPQVGGTSVRGRPYGAKQAGQAKRRPAQATDQQLKGGKCTVEGCMFRFQSSATLEYHGRCHNGSISAVPSMICPQCSSTQFSNWNSLHTHLWRSHKIDMELYSCHLCSFKTPIYSRLVNTHSKIHSEERNFKCEQCGKGFKNTKQLKNHRRLHRIVTKPSSENSDEQPPPTMHRCKDCGTAFKHRKTLLEHLCKQRNEQPQCPTCQNVFSSKSSLKLHLRTHQAIKRYKCDKCEYEAHDHNAFRRHYATHRETKRYACPHCDFRAIQSNSYRIHLQKRHPDQELSTIIYKCKVCSFSSINRGLLQSHQAKHDALSVEPSKIKVKSNLLLAHSTAMAKDQLGVAFVALDSALNT